MRWCPAFALAGAVGVAPGAPSGATPARLHSLVPPPEPAGTLERVFSETAISTGWGIIPGWAGLIILALVPALVTVGVWGVWRMRIACDPDHLAGRRLAWSLRLTTRERAVIERLAQCARTGPAAVLLVPEAFDRALGVLPAESRDDQRLHEAATRLRARLFGSRLS